MTKFFAIVAPSVTFILFAGWINAAQAAEAPASPRCATAKSTEISTTADGRTVIRVRTITVCK